MVDSAAQPSMTHVDSVPQPSITHVNSAALPSVTHVNNSASKPVTESVPHINFAPEPISSVGDPTSDESADTVDIAPATTRLALRKRQRNTQAAGEDTG